MHDWTAEAQKVKALDATWRQKARTRLREQTRPEGSLGFLESLIERIVAIQKKEKPSLARKRILIFAADHGVAQEGVSLYPSEVTRAMVLNFLNGGATINALARHAGAEVCVIDVGVDADFESHLPLRHAKIGRGTQNFTFAPAMDSFQLNAAMRVGWDLAEQARRDGIDILALGEMGIGNTTAASCVIAALTGWPVEGLTGRGTGLDESKRLHKIQVIQKALALHQQELKGPLSILQHVGGFEIAAMTGAILAAAQRDMPVVIDGWIVSASALAAVQMNSRILDYLFFAHESEEYGHRKLLESLEVKPVLNLAMRLGEASGAALALNLLEAGVRIYNEVATFAEAGVSGRVR